MSFASTWKEGFGVLHRAFLFVFALAVVHTIFVVVGGMLVGSVLMLVGLLLDSAQPPFWSTEFFTELTLYSRAYVGPWTLFVLLALEPFLFFWAARLSGEFRRSPLPLAGGGGGLEDGSPGAISAPDLR